MDIIDILAQDILDGAMRASRNIYLSRNLLSTVQEIKVDRLGSRIKVTSDVLDGLEDPENFSSI